MVLHQEWWRTFLRRRTRWQLSTIKQDFKIWKGETVKGKHIYLLCMQSFIWQVRWRLVQGLRSLLDVVQLWVVTWVDKMSSPSLSTPIIASPPPIIYFYSCWGQETGTALNKCEHGFQFSWYNSAHCLSAHSHLLQRSWTFAQSKPVHRGKQNCRKMGAWRILCQPQAVVN